jgi:anti-sigma-K factor RskA
VTGERTEELASARVLGALSAEEAQMLDRQAQDDAELRALVAELSGVTALLAGTSPALQPSALRRAELIRQLDEPNAAAPGQAPASRRWLPWALAAGLAMLCLLLGWQTNALRVRLEVAQHRLNELNRLADSLRLESADLRQSVLTLQQSNRLANMRIALLASQLHTDPQAVAVSIWDNERQSGVMVVHHLKPPPKNKDYQLWIIDPGYPTPVDAGLLQVDPSGNGRVEFKARRPIQSANQFAVTEEAKGGVAAPTLTALVLAGT